ncbi:ABC transporter permease subunit [Alkalibaculum sp. M08DMB]|uniref:Nickel import system permease protein NikB n=1 Tax=Alkalibaculum sporogenes TaxID=2655001 RepID=A0A6A7K9V7_9FIRM|nr:nickel ABC transporter permease [Alkalibaculum sporogenes]MPW26162.1 ABC transporter permease subunit [Alkalibaculum sporogenes]
MNKKEIGQRLLQIIVVLFGVSFLTFSLTYLAPGDPASAMYEASGIIPTQEMLESARLSMGLDKPFLMRYIIWLTNCLQGDFGTSFFMHREVVVLLMDRLIPTIQLTFFSLLITVIVSIPMGILAAVYKNKLPDYIIRGLTFFGISMPGFWIGLILLYIFALKLNLLPVISSGMGFQKVILPAITLAIAMSAKYTRQVRTVVLEELNKDYIIGARTRGIKESVILIKHALPNSMLPLITLLGLSLGSLLAGTAVVEIVFSYPGLGNLAVSAVSTRDYPLIQGFVLWISLMYMIINLVVDISYNFFDPRIGKKEVAK